MLHTFPSKNMGMFKDDRSLRIGIGFRLIRLSTWPSFHMLVDKLKINKDFTLFPVLRMLVEMSGTLK